ncbi:MAG: transcription antitermination factor NusB [Clostridiales bacterium]|nr:transcription antitermination factor NusB [Clostridiales bacterium]HBM80162.1 transcription antitermination factor NusB [Clostridiaceae bacterium]
MSRRSAREAAMKLIFQINYNPGEYEDILKGFDSGKNIDANDIRYINDTVKGTVSNIESIDSEIEKYSRGWKKNRIAKVDLAILRLAIYELKFTDMPYEIAINEAVEIAKKYSTDKSGSFINGVLSAVLKDKN